MIKVRGIIFIVASLAVAFFATTMVSRYLKKSAPREVRLVVAAADISPGDRLTPEKLKTVPWPESDVPRGSFSSIRKVAGRVAAGSIHEGEPINEKRLVPQGEFAESYLASRIGPGMRAVSMEIDRVSGVSGMLSPGDRVDVIATNPLQDSKGSRISRVILSGIKVLAVSYEGKNGKKEKTFRKGTATLLLSREDVLALAASEGAKLRLVKRNPSDESEGEYETTVFSASLGPKKASELRAMAQEKDRILNSRIEKGKRAVTVSFRDDDGICGFIRPGNRVDVLAISTAGNISVEGRAPGSKARLLKTSKTARIILQNVEVLTVEQEVTSPAGIVEKGDKKKMARSAQKVRCCGREKDMEKAGRLSGSKYLDGPGRLEVIGRLTLLLSPEEAEKLIVAYNNDQIKFICRNHADKEIVNTGGQKLVEAFWGDKKNYRVEVYRGKEEWGMEFDKDSLEPVEPSGLGPLPGEEEPVGGDLL